MMQESRWRVLFYYAIVLVVSSILLLQYTKQAMLPRSETKLLWAAEAAVLIGVAILRSALWRDAGWRSEQASLGTLVNDFYEPRRDALSSGFAIGTGVLLSLWWAIATWSVVLGGMRRGSMGRGLVDFQVATIVGALTGGIVGGVIGRVVGHAWEQRHRRERRERTARA
jgi:hypothetical protein